MRCKAQIGDGQWSTRLWIQSRTAWDLRNTSSVGQSQSLLNQEYFCPELSTFVILHCPCYHTLNSCDAVLQVFALDETHSWSKFQSNCESVWGPMFCEISWGLANSTCHINKYHFACMPRFLMKCNPFICWAEIDTRIEVLFNQWFCSKNSGNGMSGILLQFMWSCPVYSVYFQWNGDHHQICVQLSWGNSADQAQIKRKPTEIHCEMYFNLRLKSTPIHQSKQIGKCSLLNLTCISQCISIGLRLICAWSAPF